ncbi:MAG: hypothetical protein Q7T33_16285 [Dehalococcoidia bacterium]|nr:hypothetical protein [Dehalococcoidia bacterium]
MFRPRLLLLALVALPLLAGALFLLPSGRSNASMSVAWADLDCSGAVNIGDAQKLARSLIGLSVSQAQGCPQPGESVNVAGDVRYWGDIDCSDARTIGDAQKLARSLIGLTISAAPGCPDPQEEVALGGGTRTPTAAAATSTPVHSPTRTPTPTATRTATPDAGPGYSVALESCIDGSFEGWSGDTLFELCNGQLWIQSSYDYTYDYAYRPAVVIVYVYATGTYWMYVEDIDDPVAVTRITEFTRTCIDGAFQGWSGDTVFELCNGQTWQQSSYNYTYHYAYRPDVIIYRWGFGYRMKVEGVDETIGVKEITNFVENVYVIDENFPGYTVIVQRGNGELWSLEYGVGCLGFWEGDSVSVYSPFGLFGGVGSKIIDGDDDCSIWSAQRIYG